MTLSSTDRFWHNVYNNSAEGIKQCVDECVEEVMDIVKRHGMPANGNDPAEGVAAAVMRYISQSADARESKPTPVYVSMRPPFVAELAMVKQTCPNCGADKSNALGCHCF